jgi:predicted nucleotidyltransferase
LSQGAFRGAEGRRQKLLAELERIRRVLAEDPRVLRLGLFGSLASGAVHEWSDLDLVVVMRTELPFVDRAVQLGRRLDPQVGLDLVVYTCFHAQPGGGPALLGPGPGLGGLSLLPRPR